MARNTKRIKPNKKSTTPIALNFPCVVEPDLPFSYVYYPQNYGTFFAFSEKKDSEIFMCSCNIDLVKNYEAIRSTNTDYSYTDVLDNTLYSTTQFPKVISESSLKIGFSIRYKEKLCHRCNLKIPSLRYCHEMYGGNFKQYYGWYINQVRLRYSSLQFHDSEHSLFPEELKPILFKVTELKNIHQEKAITNQPFDRKKFLECTELGSQISKLVRKIENFFEDICREEFGYRKIGEGNVSEMVLTKIVKQLYPNFEIITHHRPKWLGSLELDIFIPELNLAFEYQGQQHFHAIKAWGGDNALKKVQERDQLKRNICKSAKVRLIEFDYTEPLYIKYLKEKIQLIESQDLE